jgi:hypothetical protein
MQKYIYGKASLKNLISGVVLLMFIFGSLLFVYGYISGFARGEDIIVKREGWNGLFIAIFCMILLTLWSGFEIGRYAEMEFSKRRTQNSS